MAHIVTINDNFPIDTDEFPITDFDLKLRGREVQVHVDYDDSLIGYVEVDGDVFLIQLYRSEVDE